MGCECSFRSKRDSVVSVHFNTPTKMIFSETSVMTPGSKSPAGKLEIGRTSSNGWDSENRLGTELVVVEIAVADGQGAAVVAQAGAIGVLYPGAGKLDVLDVNVPA